MSYFNNYKKRVLQGAKSLKDVTINEMEQDFHDYLEDSLTAQMYTYTEVEELPNLKTNKQALICINDMTENDKTALDEKVVLVSNDINIDVGCYIHFANDWWILAFEEVKSIPTHKKFIMKRCQTVLHYRYEGVVYEIPTATINLTLYSKGIKEGTYATYEDPKRTIFVGNNFVTRSVVENTRLMQDRDKLFRVTNVNDYEFKGLIKWLILSTVAIPNDDFENNVAYNQEDELARIPNKLCGEDDIYLGAKNVYIIDYDGEVEFILDDEYLNTSIIEQSENTCIISQNLIFEDIGNKFKLIVKDKSTQEIVDEKIIVVRGY